MLSYTCSQTTKGNFTHMLNTLIKRVARYLLKDERLAMYAVLNRNQQLLAIIPYPGSVEAAIDAASHLVTFTVNPDTEIAGFELPYSQVTKDDDPNVILVPVVFGMRNPTLERITINSGRAFKHTAGILAECRNIYVKFNVPNNVDNVYDYRVITLNRYNQR